MEVPDWVTATEYQVMMMMVMVMMIIMMMMMMLIRTPRQFWLTKWRGSRLC